MDLRISEKNIGIFEKILKFLFLIFSSPSNHLEPLIWSLSNSTKAQGTLLDLHGPPNGPPNGPCEANFRATLVKNGPAGSDHGQKLSIFLDRSQDNRQTWIYSHVWGQSVANIFIQFLFQNKKWERLQNQQKYILQQKNVVAGKSLPYMYICFSFQILAGTWLLLVWNTIWIRFIWVVAKKVPNQDLTEFDLIGPLCAMGLNRSHCP